MMLSTAFRVLGVALGVAAVTAILATGATAQDDAGAQLSPIELESVAHGQSITVAVGKARIIRLSTDVRDVLVANPSVADVIVKTPRTIYILGGGVGATNAFFFDGDGNEIARLEIRVQIDTVGITDAIKSLMPNVDVKVTAVANDVFLTGNVRSARVSENLQQIVSRYIGGDRVVNLMSIVEDQQVLLQVRIAEVSRGALKDVGINFQAIVSSGNLALAVATVGGTPGFLTGAASITNGNDSLTGILNALETNGLVRTLAEPTLTAMSGENANFLAGGDVPFPVTQEGGSIGVIFRSFGVGLNFTPTVLDSGRISIRLSTEVSAPDAATTVGDFFGFSVRRAETTVEVPSGGSIVIGGLLQESLTSDIQGLPWVKNVPILGALFRNNTINRTERELMVAITAYLVKPVERTDIRYPTDTIAAPSDGELFLLGRLEAIYGGSEDVPGAATTSLKGPIGYIVQ